MQVLLILSFEHLTKGDILQHFLQYPFAKMGKENIPPNYWMFVLQWWIDLKHETPRFWGQFLYFLDVVMHAHHCCSFFSSFNVINSNLMLPTFFTFALTMDLFVSIWKTCTFNSYFYALISKTLFFNFFSTTFILLSFKDPVLQLYSHLLHTRYHMS